jgi:Family of unknown function (DUF5678)
MRIDPEGDDTGRIPDLVPESSGSNGPDLSPYVGKWIAIRDGRVIASGNSFADLDEGGIAGAMDAVYRVPTGLDHTQM